MKGWGYSSASSEQDFLKRYSDFVTPLLQSEHIQGFCYTLLSDVEQENNGLLTYDRHPKAITSHKVGRSERRVQKLCKENRIPGVARFSCIWLIPKDAEKPEDGRRKENK